METASDLERPADEPANEAKRPITTSLQSGPGSRPREAVDWRVHTRFHTLSTLYHSLVPGRSGVYDEWSASVRA